VDAGASPLVNSPLSFTVEATCNGMWGVGTAIAGGGVGSEWACANKTAELGSPGAIEINLGSGGTTGQLYWMNDEDNLYLALRVATSELNRVRFDFDEAPFGTLDANEDGIALNPFGGSDTFLDQYLSDKCLNSSQTWCPSDDDDGDPDGWGSTYTGTPGEVVYEFSHPLDTTDPQDFSLAANGTDKIGFFFTLSNQNGNGAKANAQVPSFRGFLCITIANWLGGNSPTAWGSCSP